jgi:hypothetical protein
MSASNTKAPKWCFGRRMEVTNSNESAPPSCKKQEGGNDGWKQARKRAPSSKGQGGWEARAASGSAQPVWALVGAGSAPGRPWGYWCSPTPRPPAAHTPTPSLLSKQNKINKQETQGPCSQNPTPRCALDTGSGSSPAARSTQHSLCLCVCLCLRAKPALPSACAGLTPGADSPFFYPIDCPPQ